MFFFRLIFLHLNHRKMEVKYIVQRYYLTLLFVIMASTIKKLRNTVNMLFQTHLKRTVQILYYKEAFMPSSLLSSCTSAPYFIKSCSIFSCLFLDA